MIVPAGRLPPLQVNRPPRPQAGEHPAAGGLARSGEIWRDLGRDALGYPLGLPLGRPSSTHPVHPVLLQAAPEGGAVPVCKIADFGLAKLVGQDTPVASQLPRAPAWTRPRHVRDTRPVGPRRVDLLRDAAVLCAGSARLPRVKARRRDCVRPLQEEAVNGVCSHLQL